MSTTCRVAGGPQTQARADGVVLVCGQNTPAAGQGRGLLSRPSADGVGVTHILEGHLLHWKFANVNVNLSNVVTETHRIRFDQIPECCGLAKVTRTMKHYSPHLHKSIFYLFSPPPGLKHALL